MVILRTFLIVPTVLTVFGSTFDVYSDLGFEDPIASLYGGRTHFNEDSCSVNSGSGAGVCRHYHQCNDYLDPGDAHGSCPPWKVCCVPSARCGGTVRKRVSSFNSNSVRECAYTVEAVNKYVCQMRIAFSTNMESQDLDGICNTEYIIIENGGNTGANSRLCNKNQNQHIYVHLEQSQKIQISTKLSPIRSSTWQLNVTQLECPHITGTNFALANHNWYERLLQSGRDSRLIAPTGCLQYFTEMYHIVYSLNSDRYQPEVPILGYYQGYDICFARKLESKAVSITLTTPFPSAITIPGIGTPTNEAFYMCSTALYVITYNPIRFPLHTGFKIVYHDLSYCSQQPQITTTSDATTVPISEPTTETTLEATTATTTSTTGGVIIGK